MAYCHMGLIHTFILKLYIMAQLTGGNDEQFAVGIIIGGTAQAVGHTAAATSMASFIGAHISTLGAIKAGITSALALNPLFGIAAAIGGLVYIAKKCDE